MNNRDSYDDIINLPVALIAAAFGLLKIHI